MFTCDHKGDITTSQVNGHLKKDYIFDDWQGIKTHEYFDKPWMCEQQYLVWLAG